MATAPATARRYYAESALLAQRAVREARPLRRSIPRLAVAVATHQVTQAVRAQEATALILAEQGINATPDAQVNALAFTTPADSLARILDEVEVDRQFALIVASLVQDAGRAAQSVAVTARQGTQHIRYLSPPSCSRCAILAGRVYRYSEGFLRHPGCDCVMIPVAAASPDFTQDPVDLAHRGMVTGLSKADMRAINDGANFNQVVNVRRRSAGLHEPGRALARAGRPTPEAIYRSTPNRREAVEALARFGYLRP